MAKQGTQSVEQAESLQQLRAAYVRRKRSISRKPVREPLLHAGGFARTAQCSRCGSYKTRTLNSNLYEGTRQHSCNSCGMKFLTAMAEADEPGFKLKERAPKQRQQREPKQRKPGRYLVKLTHRGRTMTLAQWATETGVRSETLRSRIRLGWTVDEIFGESVRGRTLTHYGVTASVREWSQRTRLSVGAIRSRMRRGWTDQQIIETPFRKSKRHRAPKEKPERPVKKQRTLTHDNRSMSISEWATETGISVDVIYGRLRLGWSIEDALSSSRLRTLTHNGVTASIREWSAKTGLSVGAIRARMRRGWTDQQVLETPFNKHPRQLASKINPAKPARQRRMLTHDGRTMSVADWSAETGIAVAVIDGRLRLGWNTKATLETPVKTPHLIMHEGRVQSAADWSRETGVKLQLILHRLQRGWQMSEIISTAAGMPRSKPVKGH